MAVYVSNPAGRLGRYYSRGKSLSDVMPTSATEVFETFTGVYDVKKEARMSRLMKKKDLQAALLEMEEEDLEVVFESNSETTATLLSQELYVGASGLLHHHTGASEKKRKWNQSIRWAWWAVKLSNVWKVRYN